MKKKFIITAVVGITLILGITVLYLRLLEKHSTLVKDEEITTVYLTKDMDRMFVEEELKDYPQIEVVSEFKDVMKITDSKCVSIWIDKNAVDLVDNIMLSKVAKRGYPVVLIGYSDELYSFRELLDIYNLGEREHLNSYKVYSTSGYTIALWKREAEPKPMDMPNSGNLFIKGNNKEPEVAELLALTDMLIEDKIPTY